MSGKLSDLTLSNGTRVAGAANESITVSIPRFLTLHLSASLRAGLLSGLGALSIFFFFSDFVFLFLLYSL